jgi:hypothetical protein
MHAELNNAVAHHVNRPSAAVGQTDDERAVFDWALSLGGRYTEPDQMLPMFIREVEIQGSGGDWSIEDQLIFFLSISLRKLTSTLSRRKPRSFLPLKLSPIG